VQGLYRQRSPRGAVRLGSPHRLEPGQGVELSQDTDAERLPVHPERMDLLERRAEVVRHESLGGARDQAQAGDTDQHEAGDDAREGE
jgi:hypothetical protein